MRKAVIIIILFPALCFAQDITSSLDALSSLSHGLEASRELAQCDLGVIPNGWPCSGHITSRFGFRMHPIFHKWSHHSGIDIAGRRGTTVKATADGKVIFADRGYHRGYTGYGNIVVIRHSDHVVTMYAHLDTIRVEAGDRVKRGDVVGRIGNTGRSTGNHVHYEIRVDGVPVDPEDWM